MLPGVVTEVKNVSYQGLTSQIRDYIAFSRAGPNPIRFDLWVRPSTRVSEPLQQQIRLWRVNIEYIR
jgi:hypothetical protein